MKPIAIFRHSPTEGPGYFADYLHARNVPWQLIALDAGEPVPIDPDPFSGLVFMGGPMSVNDDLPWIPPVLELIRRGVAADVPVLGHCLGGQLISKALGGVVGANPVKEIGWGEITVDDNPVAREWFGDIDRFKSFHWHGETFTLPPGGVRIMGSQWCANQGYVVGKSLGMQCHVEITEKLMDAWIADGTAELQAHPGPSVQTPEQMRATRDRDMDELHRVAERLYDHWLAGLKR